MEGRAGILLAWIGEQPAEPALLEPVRQGVEAALHCPVRLGVRSGVPAASLDARRAQRSSTKLLRWLLDDLPAGSQKIVGITDADLFIPVLTFVFGEAQLGGRVAVVSLARLGQHYDGRPASPQLRTIRVVKECLHELGHTFGLVHCDRPSCVMSRSNSVVDVDAKRPVFCRDCRIRLRALRGEDR